MICNFRKALRPTSLGSLLLFPDEKNRSVAESAKLRITENHNA